MIMKYIDIGANLTSTKFDNILNDTLKESFDNNLESIIVTGATLSGSKYARKIVYENLQYNLYFTAGVHPHNAKDYNLKQQEELKELLKDPKAVAIGECGLDFNRNHSTREKQLLAFEKQIQLAMEVDKPLFLHERKASDDFINMLNKYKGSVKGVVHCFTGNKETVKKYLSMGFYIGITGWICDNERNKELMEAIKYIPLDKLMVETDSPYLSPLDKSKLNTPKNIKYTVKKIADILNMNEEVLAEQLNKNTKRFFKIN